MKKLVRSISRDGQNGDDELLIPDVFEDEELEK